MRQNQKGAKNMNHTEHMNEVARRHRHLTRRLVKDAAGTYLELQTKIIVSGQWVELHAIGGIQVSVEVGTRMLYPKGMIEARRVKRRLRTK
jgi:hypothetical protein